MKHAGKSPWLFLKRLHILNLNEQDIAGLCGFNVKRTGDVVDLRQIHVFDIIGGIIVFDLASGPVETFNFDDFVVGNGATSGNYTSSVRYVYGCESG